MSAMNTSTEPSLTNAPASTPLPPALFRSLRLRGLALKNRIMVSPMCMYSAKDGVADDFHLAHLGRFAMGGAGIVFVEATAVSQQGRITHGCLGLWNDEQQAGLQRITALMHRLGCAAGIQLSHAGHKGSSAAPWDGAGPLTGGTLGDPWDTVSASAAPFDQGWPVPAELSAAALDTLVADFVAAAIRADAAGFDMVEIHCAHGYLLHSFLSPLANRRDDAYGGDLAGRMRFPLRVIEAVRGAWPRAKPLAVRVSSVDGIDVGWSADDTVAFGRALAAIGVDLIDCSSGGMPLERHQNLVSRTAGFHVPYAERVRRETGVSTVAVGLIRDAAHADGIVDAGQADLVAIAREALFDPNWPLHAELRLRGAPAWAAWPEPHGWWLMRRARQQGDRFDSLAHSLSAP